LGEILIVTFRTVGLQRP